VYNGNYTYYLEEKAKRASAAASIAADAPTAIQKESSTKLSYQEQKQRDSQKRKLERQVEDAEAKIDRLEKQQEEIQTQMADPEIATNFDKLGPLQEQLSAVQKKLDQANTDWEDSLMKLEEFE
ncbi:ABC transporter ATP-binding protein, partial [Lactobacillus sp. XV13L]|nr:ABC transporter ATP-binding protein [Lactobacillus sp. XV13L]